MTKKKKDKKGKGAEKTAQKTEKKADRKMKKSLKEKGEEDIEAMIAEFQEKDKRLASVVEEKCPNPSPRSNMSLTPHPEKDELIMFGGEFFNGSQTLLYNDLFFYNIKNNEWTKVTAPNAPPPRCSHQAVALNQGGGQLWVFGGEFASPSLSQFYHYRDLWCFHLKEKRWDKIKTSNPPTSRSGHRMVACKRQLIVFGGFHDNLREYKYHNDVHAFNLDTFTWTKLEVSGAPPAPRSGCQMAVLHDQRHIVVYGGYSKESQKKDVESGKTHSDMYLLTPEGKNKDDTAPVKWKWALTKQSGAKPSPRCGFSLSTLPANRAFMFGGVFDEEEEESMNGVFYNEMFNLDLESGKWFEVTLRGKREDKEKKRRRKKKEEVKEGEERMEEEEEEEGEEEEEEGVEESLEKMKVEGETSQNDQMDSGASRGADTTFDDGVFTVTIGPQSSGKVSGAESSAATAAVEAFIPRPRMNAIMALKHGILYMFGGMFEEGDKQITLADMYSLDLHKLDEWKTLIHDDASKMEWIDTDSSSDDEDEDDSEDEEGAVGGESEDEDEGSQMEVSVPDVRHGESLNDYFGRTRDYWLELADSQATKGGEELLGKALKKAAFQLAEIHFKAEEK